MRIAITIVLLVVSAPTFSFAKDDLDDRSTLNAIREVQTENIESVHQLVISCVTKFEWFKANAVPITEQTLFWEPSRNKFLATDPFPDENDRSWKKRPVSISRMFGGPDDRNFPWKLFADYSDEQLKERVAVLDTSNETNSYEITAYWTASDGPKLFVKLFIDEANCYYPHLVVCKSGDSWDDSHLVFESKHSYQRIENTVVPKSADIKFYLDKSRTIERRKTVSIDQIWLNPELGKEIRSIGDLTAVSTELASSPTSDNPLLGKVVLFESEAANLSQTPRENVRVETLAGRQYFVWANKIGDTTYDYWTPADKVLKMRVFNRLEDATEYCETKFPRTSDK